jgi:hypothetical protein
LKKFVKEGKGKKVETKQQQRPNVEPAGSGDTINTIHGVIDKKQASRSMWREKISKVMLVEKSTFGDSKANPITIQKLTRGQVPIISFSDADLVGVALPHTDPLVIKVRIDVQNVKRVLVDTGSDLDVIYKNLFDKMKPVSLQKMDHPIYSCSLSPIWPLGVVTLNVKLGPMVVPVKFVVLDVHAPYNAILGRSWIGAMKAVTSTIHQRLKYVCPEGVVTVRGSQSTARECSGGAVGSTLTDKRPEATPDVSIQLAEASKYNQSLLLSGKAHSDPLKRKCAETSSPDSGKQKTEA